MRLKKAQNIIGGRLPAVADVLVPLLRPAWALIPTETPLSALPHGAHRLGGAPGLPRGFEWPTSGQRSLSFVLQLDLAALAQHPGNAASDGATNLPNSGWLLLFVDTKTEPMETRCLWMAADRSTLSTRNADGRLRSSKWSAFALEAVPIWTLPSPATLALHRGLAAVDLGEYAELRRRLRGGAPNSLLHQFLGHPEHGLTEPAAVLVQLDHDPLGAPWPGDDAGHLRVVAPIETPSTY